MSNVINLPLKRVEEPQDLPSELQQELNQLVSDLSSKLEIDTSIASSVISEALPLISEFILADLVRRAPEGISLFSIIESAKERMTHALDVNTGNAPQAS